ncbi:hypothetical protein ACHAXR_012709 [Thalassiosira sp. AJA248-18]
MKGDLDLDLDSYEPVAASTTTAAAAAAILDSSNRLKSSVINSACESTAEGMIYANFASSEQGQNLQNAITSSEAVEKICNSLSSSTNTSLGDTEHLEKSRLFNESVQSKDNVDIHTDAMDMHKEDEKAESSPSEPSTPNKIDEEPINDSMVEISNSLMQDCTNTLGNSYTDAENGKDHETTNNEGSSLKTKEVHHQSGVGNLGCVSNSLIMHDGDCADDANENNENTTSKTPKSSLNLSRLDGTPSSTNPNVSMSQGNSQNKKADCTEKREDVPQFNTRNEEESIPGGSEQTAELLKTGMSKKNIHDQHNSSAGRDNSSPQSSAASESLQTTATQTTERESTKKQKKTQFIPLKSAPPDDRASLLTRGISLFARSSKQLHYAKWDNDANSVISEMSQDAKSEKPASTWDKSNDTALSQHLEESGLVLLKRLIEFLSECPPAPDEDESKKGLPGSTQEKRQRGLTLPASAIGWLSTQMGDSCNGVFEGLGDCYQVPKQQLQCLHTMFRRVTSIRISGEAWPPPHASSNKATSDISGTPKKFTNPEKGSLSSKILSKFSGEQSIEEGSLDDESCATTPSRVGTNDGTEIVVSPFQRYYHELQHKPNVDMSFFPNATKVVIDGIPPHWVTNLDSLQKLDMFQMEKGCILDINQLFFPSDLSDINQNSPLELRRDLSLIDEGKEKEGPGNGGKTENTALAVYPSLSKLRLSNCAIGETAGLRGRRTTSSIPRLPTFSRFPNLLSLNLSNNELFKTKTVVAGLSSLPLLSSINLSYNRLSRYGHSLCCGCYPLNQIVLTHCVATTSMDNIFMHIGNVTELILTGNEISSSRGLDRLFSLERLSLDENNIHSLANIASIAKIPFLMAFDLKGNTLESDDPASCRIKVFNLFREVRCNNLPKNATFRDMQRLLPILDNEIATKDELVALKDLTFRQTVIPVDSMLSSENKDGFTDTKNIDDSTEISVNMPDQSGGLRRIVKNSPINTAHFRMAGSASLDETSAGCSARFHNNLDSRSETKGGIRQHSIQFNVKELIASIRPDLGSDSFLIRERDGNISSGELMARSYSHHSEDKDGNTIASSPDISFPFSLPPALLAEAGDDVWNPTSQLDQIVPAATIVWEATSYNDCIERGDTTEFVEENEAIDLVDEPPVEQDKDPIETVESNSLNDNSGELSPASPHKEQEEEGDCHEDHSDRADEDSRKSMFGGIWEQSYRDNVTKNKKDVLEPIDSAERTTPELLDFNAMEQSSQYDGPLDYRSLYVSSDLDLYFDSFVFHPESSENDLQEDSQTGRTMSPRIQLFKFDRNFLINRARQHRASLASSTDFREKYIGVWKLGVLACGSYARSRLPPVKLAKRGFHGDIIAHAGKDIMISESRKFILCLSDSALYFIVDDDISPQKSTEGKRTFPSRVPPNSVSELCTPETELWLHMNLLTIYVFSQSQTFVDAYWPHAVARHPLDCLRGITIGFQFQRLILRFCVGNTLEYTYVILTSNKLQTVSLLQKLQAHVPDTQTIAMGGALIDNDDKTFLDALGARRSNEVVIHYQILHQIWKRGDREASRRAFVLTDSKAYLLDETYTGDGTRREEDEKDKSKNKLGDVSLSIIDSARLSHVTEVRAANEDPRKITLVILPQNKLKRSHRWRLVCNDGEGAERLIDDVRKAIRIIST